MFTRRERATNENIKITFYQEETPTNFQVGVIGARKKPYILKFNPDEVSCSCPDYFHRTIKPICKHIYFIIHLARNHLIFNTVNEITELKTEEKINIIRENLKAVIDQKKLEQNNTVSNTISIERDDCCSICMSELTGEIDKCRSCAHVLHMDCLRGWWDIRVNSWTNNKGKCPYCRHNSGFMHIFSEVEDPWEKFNFETNIIEQPSNVLEIMERLEGMNVGC